MVLSKGEVYIFRGRGVIVDVYKADDKIVTSGKTSLADIDLRRTYRVIDSVATGRIPFLFCANNTTDKAYISLNETTYNNQNSAARNQ